MSYFLREISRSDLPQISSWRNDPGLIENLASPFRFIDLEVDTKWFESYMASRANNVRLAICQRDSGSIIGAAYLLSIDWVSRSCEFSIFIGDVHSRGKGVGEFAIQHVLRHAFEDLNLRRVALNVLENNARALHLYRKNGFVDEGRLRQAVAKRGAYFDLIQMAILSDEFYSSGTIDRS
ncbi:GNAT family N-acetyltransferase [Massilia glaciei]|uniref:N-acetyltransferase n=1 Tax=Massilia glaciei TaxID=1524097 RepID=A0A2U2HN95_9BURK|nr:GNAT family protein [Massilia glaciei]PWF48906.1 N-acetyltransferase [Massilia glaciei]